MTVLGVEKFKPSAIRETVADALRRTLLEGRLRSGENLSEVSIASEFNISRGPVREAMLVLAAEGLLNHAQNRGFTVLNFTEEDQRQIESVRLPLETLALSEAKQKVTTRDIGRLKAFKDNLVQLFEAEDNYGRMHAEVEFHSAICELAGNPWLIASLKRVLIPAFTYGTAFHMNQPDLSGKTLNDLHNLYIDFLEGSSSRTAEECVRLHTGLGIAAS